MTASADQPSDWLHLYSQTTDPSHPTTYAHGRLINGGTGPYAATGSDAALAVDLGGFPDANSTFPFTCVFSLVTPVQFPDTSVTQITVSVTLAFGRRRPAAPSRPGSRPSARAAEPPR